MLWFLFSLVMSACSAANADNMSLRILCLGDSLTEGYGVAKEEAYPALVEAKFKAAMASHKNAPDVTLINAGISGSTTASAPSRLQWYLKQKPDYLFLALGANDGLRGQDIDAAKKNLRDTIRLAKKNHIAVWLAGMAMPKNYGADYSKRFRQMFIDLAREEKVAFMPFLLEGVALHPELIQADGLHPNEKGHQEMARHVYEFMNNHLKETKP